MGDKVAILGTVPNSRSRVPYNDESWDVWCCSGGNSQTNAPPRVTEWYELHALVDLHSEEHAAWYGPYLQWINAQKFPVWMQEKNDDCPRAQVFPRRQLTERFGPNKAGKANWFTSSPAWMLGFAILRGYRTIGVFGVDMAAAQEHYTGQKAGFHRWFEICRELGIKIIVPLESSLAFTYPLYGYAEASRLGRHLVSRETDMQNRLNFLRNQGALLQREIAQLEGAFEQIVFDRRTYTSGLDEAEVDDTGVELYTGPLVDRVGPIITPPQPQPVMQIGQVGQPLPPAPADRLPSMADFPDNPDAGALLGKPNGAAPPHKE